MEKVVKFGVCEVEVRVKGLGSGCESVIIVLEVVGLKVKIIEDCILIFYNGCCFCKK